ncbi:MAG TPA: type II secretion system protein N [Rhodanobacter sp.]|nr:type II secretion system protein N [Rhodanobacter sp.]
MKLLRNSLVGLAIFVLLVALLVAFLPARWVMPWLQPQLHGVRLQQVHGSVWDGEASVTTGADGSLQGRLHWRLSRRLLLGQLHAQWQFDGLQLKSSGVVRRLPDKRIELQAVSLDADLAVLGLPSDPQLGQPRGTLQVSVAHALLQGGWPLQLQARADWSKAAMHTADGDVSLGDLRLQAQSQGGVVMAQANDDGRGPLQVRGQLQLSPLGWRLDAILHARHTDPLLQHWLNRLGKPAGDGSVHIQRQGGLAIPAPMMPQDLRK